MGAGVEGIDGQQQAGQAREVTRRNPSIGEQAAQGEQQCKDQRCDGQSNNPAVGHPRESDHQPCVNK